MEQVSLSLREELDLIGKELHQHFSPTQLEVLARQTGFVQRKSKLTAQDFVAVCTFLDHDLSTQSLTSLCSQLDAARNVSMSAEGLNQRFHESGVAFLRTLFSTLLREKLASSLPIPWDLDTYFHRIRILDATVFQLPDIYASRYPGSGGSAHTAGIKIQLEYDLKTGEFLHVDVGSGSTSDGLYGAKLAKTVEKQDLCIRDLGYFCLEDFEQIEKREAYYISRLKINVRIFQKNDEVERFKNGKVRKDSVYTEIDLEAIMNQLTPGEVLEIHEVYLGREKKLVPRLLIYKLTQEQTQERLAIRAKNEKKKGITYKERTKRLSGINVYITNIPKEYVDKEYIYSLYSLRWQVEILFKTWKSFFHIDWIKPVKIERFECHLYGKLIALLLTSSLMFQMREILLRKKKREVSELKSIAILKTYLGSLHDALNGHIDDIVHVLQQILQMIEKNGRKSHRYKKKTVFDILGVAYECDQKSRTAA
ncbi:IS4 family transposase [Bacillus sp. BRMEA1]|uniref:IS4 family transposase n=1 Tax=Neobacillus endophyticus TaxID=2738405 RepID=UPI0015649382|nr:IS4 family transposase [Neobacillus endophyticus]NRD80963.1 IS4 family transposase [Neobacillus endophyticus]